jgi:hypothetical protein
MTSGSRETGQMRLSGLSRELFPVIDAGDGVACTGLNAESLQDDRSIYWIS